MPNSNSEQVSKSDCIQVISEKINSDNFRLVKYEIQKYEERVGFLGEHSSLKIEIERAGAREDFTLFLKAMPMHKEHRVGLQMMGGFFKESNFFNKYLSLLIQHSIKFLDKVLPRCYLASEEIFIFDDLKIQGYKMMDSRGLLELKYVEAGLIALAKLHASGFILEDRQCAKLTKNMEKELEEAFYTENVMALKFADSHKYGLNALIDFTHDNTMKLPKEEFKDIVYKAIDQQRSFAKPSNKYKNTICHADPWINNFLFKNLENSLTNCVLLDFQTYRYAPPAQDVLSFLHLVTDRKLRNQHLDYLSKLYFKELQNHLKNAKLIDAITETEFFESCRFYKQFALLQTITHHQMNNLSKEIIEELFSSPEYMRQVLMGETHKYDFMMRVCREDLVFGERTKEIVGELREFFEQQLYCNK